MELRHFLETETMKSRERAKTSIKKVSSRVKTSTSLSRAKTSVWRTLSLLSIFNESILEKIFSLQNSIYVISY